MHESLIYIKKIMEIISTLPAVVKEVKPINFLYFRTETYIHQLEKFISVAKDLFREAVKNDLHVTGPVHWHYFGFTGDVSKPFNLEIALPVSHVIPDYDGAFHFKRTEPFKCVSLTHEGGWLDLPKSYDKAMEFIQEHNLQPIAANRELYLNADFANPEANVTEIQIGVK
jgi:effector-binding domain-containing protein